MLGARPRDLDLVTIPKYAGKTTEQFTRLLLNLTVLASARAGGDAAAVGGWHWVDQGITRDLVVARRP